MRLFRVLGVALLATTVAASMKELEAMMPKCAVCMSRPTLTVPLTDCRSLNVWRRLCLNPVAPLPIKPASVPILRTPRHWRNACSSAAASARVSVGSEIEVWLD